MHVVGVVCMLRVYFGQPTAAVTQVSVLAARQLPSAAGSASQSQRQSVVVLFVSCCNSSLIVGAEVCVFL